MSIVQDSNSPYATAFNLQAAGEAVYMTAEDAVLGKVLATVYRADPASKSLSVILIGNHGTAGYVDMTLDSASRYYGACMSLGAAHQTSQVRKALAIAVLRTYSTMDRPLRRVLFRRAAAKLGVKGDLPLRYYDQTAAGALGSKFRLVYGKFPTDIGRRQIEAGLLLPKFIRSSVLDIVYEDTDSTIDQNNDLVYMLGDQLEQLFDPLSEYSPEPTERLYVPPTDSITTLEDDTQEVQDICEELYLLQSSVRASLIEFLQSFLIPLRVRVLNHELPDMTIGKLNTIFPPTIDEMFRINNIFYESLQQALPYGSFEIMKACGTTIPYFYRVCIRHEAATKNFARSLATTDPALKKEIDKHSPQKIEAVMHNSLHLARMKLILDRLMATKQWTTSEKALADEFHQVSTGTIDQFGKEKGVATTNQRIFTPSGKMLVEIAAGWPAELEYGWINRRVVTIFDAVDVVEPNAARRQLHNIVIMFTDALVILEPAEPIPMTSLSGLHLPSIGDILMHAMLNEAPLDVNLPPLKVIGWAPILDVFFLSFGPKSLQITTQPEPLACKLDEGQDKHYTKIYRLIRPDHVADKFVELLAKAKVTTKTQPFHLFKISSLPTQTEVVKTGATNLSIYSTVHEIQGYQAEVNRSPIAVFLNTPFDINDLATNDLCGAVCVTFQTGMEKIQVKVLSLVGYESFREVTKEQFKDYAINEVTYLATLALSSQHPAAIPGIIATSSEVTKNILLWASQPPDKVQWHHRRSMFGTRPNLSKLLQPISNGASAPPKLTDNNRNTWNAIDSPRMDQPVSKPRASFMPSKSSVVSNLPRLPSAPDLSVAAGRGTKSAPKLKPLPATIEKSPAALPTDLPLPGKAGEEPDHSPSSFHTAGGSPSEFASMAQHEPAASPANPPPLRKKDKFVDSVARDRSVRDLAQAPSMASMRSMPQSQESIGYKFPRDGADNSSWDDVNTELSTEFSSAEEAEQRDVDAWYEGLDQRDAASLSTSLSEEAGETSSLYDAANERGVPKVDSSKSIRLSAFLDRSNSELYNRHSGIAFPAVLVDNEDEDSLAHIRNFSVDTIGSSRSGFSTGSAETVETEQDDFSYLADLVQDAEVMSNSASAGRIYPDLRETSLVRLGSYVVKSDRASYGSLSRKGQGSNWALPGFDEEPEFYGSDEATPTLANLNRVEDEDVEAMLGSVNQWLDEENARDDESPSGTAGNTPVLTLDRPPRLMMPENSNHTINSFRRMIMSSSLNTLQLASLTIQIDQIANAAPEPARTELERIKGSLTDMYNQTQQFAQSYTSSDVDVLRSLPAKESKVRRHLIFAVHSLLALGYAQLIPGLLEMEWVRRSKLHEGLGDDIPLSLWETTR